ncbi:MAG: acyl-CoA dehydrogenase, partial [Pseudomonadota bacterium]
MDISLSAEHEMFRDEVKTFLDDALTPELRQAAAFCPGIFLDYEHNMAWHKILYAKGWIAPA